MRGHAVQSVLLDLHKSLRSCNDRAMHLGAPSCYPESLARNQVSDRRKEEPEERRKEYVFDQRLL